MPEHAKFNSSTANGKSLLRSSAKLCLISLSACLLTAQGCRDDAYFRELRIKQAEEHFEKIRSSQMPEGAVLTLPVCIETALKNNLDLKVSELKESIERERRTAAYLGMLPEMNVEASLTDRSNEPGGQSINLVTNQQSLAPSKSSEEKEFTFKYELVFSALDFGLAYFNSVQQDDKTVLAGVQRKRTAQNLSMSVARAYFKVAAAQRSIDDAESLIRLSESSLTDIEDMEKGNGLHPLKAAEEKAALLRLKQSLMDYRNDYESACIELRSLMGFQPITDIKVDCSCMDALAELQLPSIEAMETAALRERPELYEANIASDVSAIEARKAILLMFPNVKIFTDFNYSSNKYLYNQAWWELGVKAAYNLLKLPNQIQQYKALSKETEQLDMKTLALSIGVIAQVRIAHANFMEVRRRYELANSISKVYSGYLKVAGDRAKASGDISPLDLAKLEMQAGDTSIKKGQMMASYYFAYYTLLNSIGVSSIDECIKPQTPKLDELPSQESGKTSESKAN